ncbi:MAG: restriction endonuclease [Bacillales bacterium]|nr:restriction endonuclease [Bacillales bacterium]
MIMTNEYPKTWKDLQDLVCKYFNEAGYIAKTPVNIGLVRGSAEVDVFVEAKNEIFKTIICECKYWDNPIPQEKVHAFRTVVADSGANLGIVISKKGFQKGAKEAAYKTNVLLKTWEEFLEMIERQWIIRRLIKLKIRSNPLSDYTDFLMIERTRGKIIDIEEYNRLLTQYMMVFSFIWSLDLEKLSPECISFNNSNYSYCNVLFDYLEKEIDNAILKFEKLFQTCPLTEDEKSDGAHLLFTLLADLFKDIKIEEENNIK